MQSGSYCIYLSAEEYLIPTVAFPTAVFFLLSLANFLEHWHVWLMPALLHRGQLVKLLQSLITTEYSYLMDRQTNGIRSGCTGIS